MSSKFQSFDEYWSLFLLRSLPFASGRGGLGRTSLGLARAALGTLAARRGSGLRRPVEVRWAVAATLLSWGKVLAGTFEQEVAEATRGGTARRPPLPAVAELDGRRRSTPRAPAWAVWM
jgi:hypothetical protein